VYANFSPPTARRAALAARATKAARLGERGEAPRGCASASRCAGSEELRPSLLAESGGTALLELAAMAGLLLLARAAVGEERQRRVRGAALDGQRGGGDERK
jgi:hypothetical protein